MSGPVEVVSTIQVAASGWEAIPRRRPAGICLAIAVLVVCAASYQTGLLFSGSREPVPNPAMLPVSPIERHFIEVSAPPSTVFAAGAPTLAIQDSLGADCRPEEWAALPVPNIGMIGAVPIEWGVAETPRSQEIVLASGGPLPTTETPPGEACRLAELAAALAFAGLSGAEQAGFRAGDHGVFPINSDRGSSPKGDTSFIHYDLDPDFPGIRPLTAALAGTSPPSSSGNQTSSPETILLPFFGGFSDPFTLASTTFGLDVPSYPTISPDVAYFIFADNFAQPGAAGAGNPPSGPGPRSGADPVPEPSAVSILVVGLAGICIARVCREGKRTSQRGSGPRTSRAGRWLAQRLPGSRRSNRIGCAPASADAATPQK